MIKSQGLQIGQLLFLSVLLGIFVGVDLLAVHGMVKCRDGEILSAPYQPLCLPNKGNPIS